jgi:hypothetical protein
MGVAVIIDKFFKDNIFIRLSINIYKLVSSGFDAKKM